MYTVTNNSVCYKTDVQNRTKPSSRTPLDAHNGFEYVVYVDSTVFEMISTFAHEQFIPFGNL